MVKNNSLSITLDRESAIYYPLQVVSGTVDLKVTDAIKKARGLRLEVSGKSCVEWNEAAGKTSRKFQGEEKHLCIVTYLFGQKEDETLEVPVGLHSYKFSCQLPPDLPYSVEGEFGYIRYKVDATLDIQWSLLDLHAKLPFTVARHDDLNQFPELKLAQEVEEMKKFCWGICDSNPLLVKIRLTKSGFSVGENMHIMIEFNNMSNHNVERTEIALIQKEKFICSDPVKKERTKKTKVVQTVAKGVNKNSSLKFDHILEIPQILMSTNRRYTQVYQITYELRIIVVTDGCSSSPVLKIPVTIGNVCIHDVPSISIN